MTTDCADCGHPEHAPGTDCETPVHHGPSRMHLCLCLHKPDACEACPPPLNCQGGPFGYSDVYYLQRGISLRSKHNEKILPSGNTEPEPDKTPCSDPPCGYFHGELCDRHGTEQDHDAGNHQHCDQTCEQAFPWDQMRNFILYRALPGAQGALNELLRRAANRSALMDAHIALVSEAAKRYQHIQELEQRVRYLEAELRIGEPWKCPCCSKDNNRNVCVICETDRPDPEDNE